MIRAGALAVLIVVGLGLSGCSTPPPTASPTFIRPGGPDGSSATAIPTSPEVTQADVDFVQAMIAHHGQAIELAGLAAVRAGDGELALFAELIAQAQQAELGVMADWLQRGGIAVDDHGHDAATMPGGISATMMDRARTSSGGEFDGIFLQAMIAHHEGALTMAQTRLDAGGDSSITRLAQSIISGQGLEIERLREIALRLGVIVGS